ncbi:hypothetical protein FVEN_g12374 [Fusarium venenatum]|nr:hypothetical protein FVEN_g12374 [Fusarium venenatum]
MCDPYKPSQTEGVRALTEVVQQYVARCPRTKMIILGFSQVETTNLQDPDRLYLLIDWEPVAAIVLMGDPSTTKGQAFHVGSSKGDGIFPHQKPNRCHYVSGKAVSFCDVGDPFCEAGGHDLSTHMRYVSAAYGQMATDFAVSMFHLA